MQLQKGYTRQGQSKIRSIKIKHREKNRILLQKKNQTCNKKGEKNLGRTKNKKNWIPELSQLVWNNKRIDKET